MPFIAQLNRFLFKNSVINFADLFHRLKLRFLFLTFYEGKVSMSKVPRDRDSSFNPILIPKRGNIALGIGNVISLYAKGMRISDIEEQIKEVYDFEVSTSTISRITNTITTEVITW